ncbi:MAG: TolC family protein [Myxococcota bacterium]|nr:TolC family protein [Myxococcota bacterium]
MHRFLGLVVVLVATTARADVLPRVLFQPADPTGPGAAPPPAPPTPVDDLTAWAGPAKATSLPELLQLAVRQAPALQSARIDIAIAAARIEQTYGRDDWQLRAQALGSTTAGRVNGQDVDHIYTFSGNIDLFRALPTGGTVTFHAGTNYNNIQYQDGAANDVFGGTSWTHDVSAGISQPLLRGRGRWLYDAQERIATISRDTFVLARRVAAIQTVQIVVAAYWDLVLAERQIAITQSSLELAKERLRITQIGNQGGKVPRSEIPAVQQIIATREEDVLNGELAVLDRSFTLRRAVGMPIGKGELGLRLGAELQTREATFDLGALTERAFTASPELAQIAKQDQGARLEIEITENGLLPQLDAALSLGPTGTDNRFGTAAKNLAKFDTLSINGSLTFQHSFGQENVRGLAREARENRKKLVVNAFDLRQQIAQTMARAVAQLEVARRRVALSQRAIDLANENIKIETDRFNLGKSTNFDVLGRQEELRQAELRRAQSMIDWHKAESVVQALTGDILPAYGITVE